MCKEDRQRRKEQLKKQTVITIVVNEKKKEKKTIIGRSIFHNTNDIIRSNIKRKQISSMHYFAFDSSLAKT